MNHINNIFNNYKFNEFGIEIGLYSVNSHHSVYLSNVTFQI